MYVCMYIHTHTHTHTSCIANNSDVETIRYTIIKICTLEKKYIYRHTHTHTERYVCITEMNIILHKAIAQVIVFSFSRSKTFGLCQIFKIC